MYLIKIAFIICITTGFAANAQSPSKDDYSGKQTNEWIDVQKRLSEKKAKVESQNSIVKNLIVEKAKAPIAEQSKKGELLQAEHKKLQTYISEYNALSAEYESKYPEKGLKENRLYRRVDQKSIDGIENELTLEGRLGILHNRVMRQYPNSATKEEAPKKIIPVKKKKVEVAPNTEKDVTDQLILQK